MGKPATATQAISAITSYALFATLLAPLVFKQELMDAPRVSMALPLAKAAVDAESAGSCWNLFVLTVPATVTLALMPPLAPYVPPITFSLNK
jgi:hypothetical protein